MLGGLEVHMLHRALALFSAALIGCAAAWLVVGLAEPAKGSAFSAPRVPVGTAAPPGCVVMGGVDILWVDEGGGICLRRRVADGVPAEPVVESAPTPPITFGRDREIQDMDVGEIGWTLPWAFSGDEHDLRVNRNYPVMPWSSGTAATKIERTAGGVRLLEGEVKIGGGWPLERCLPVEVPPCWTDEERMSDPPPNPALESSNGGRELRVWLRDGTTLSLRSHKHPIRISTSQWSCCLMPWNGSSGPHGQGCPGDPPEGRCDPTEVARHDREAAAFLDAR